MNNQQRSPEPLEDFSTIEVCGEQGGFEANEELQLLQGNDEKRSPVNAPQKSEREPPQNTESNQSTNPHMKKPAIIEAQTCWSSRGTFMGELERFTREMSFETEVFDIYNPGEQSLEGVQPAILAITYKLYKQKSKGKPTSKYILDFGRPKLVVKKKVRENKQLPADIRNLSKRLRTSSSSKSLARCQPPSAEVKKPVSRTKPQHSNRKSQCSIKSPTARSLLEPQHAKLLSPRTTMSQVSLVHKVFKREAPTNTPHMTSSTKLPKKRRS